MNPNGRPKVDNPRNKRLCIRVTEEELNEISETAEKFEMTKTDCVLYAIHKLNESAEQ